LPIESEPFVHDYAKGRVEEKEFWRSIALLTGLTDPFINSLKLRFQSVLDCTRDVYAGDRRIHCYQDMKSYVEEKRIQEKILLLEFRYRATGKLRLREWKETLLEEMKTLRDSWRRAADRILEGAGESPENVILYGGYLEPIKHLIGPENRVEIVLLEEHWKSPLDTLRTILWRHGFDISDKTIEQYLRLQRTYLDLVINSRDIDEAHEAWTQMARRPTRISISRQRSAGEDVQEELRW